MTSLPAVPYCRPHAREVCGLFRVERWVNLAPKSKAKKSKRTSELDVLLDSLLVAGEPELVPVAAGV
jgi:hypothetical protein